MRISLITTLANALRKLPRYRARCDPEQVPITARRATPTSRIRCIAEAPYSQGGLFRQACSEPAKKGSTWVFVAGDSGLRH